ncbi:MAG: UDP-N-acetylmuramate dehydrogenase [Thermoanaerobaculia bacterium]|nr:UDP-N-acetylmuramate dehydrogenase [Thermoanaerobaculia bacterium]
MLTLREQEPLAPRTTLGLGGPARWFVAAQSEAELVEALGWAVARDLPAILLGSGSNLVVGDAGYPGLVIAVETRGLTWQTAGNVTRVTAQAGEGWDGLVAATVAAGLGGLEALSGIPGSVGATPIQNVGAYGQEVATHLTRVRLFDRRAAQVVEIDRAACAFAYRDSRFRRDPTAFAVLAVEFELPRCEQVTVAYPELARALGETAPSPAAVRAAVLALRRSKSMVFDPADPNHRSVGSFFLNPVVSAEQAEAVVARALVIGAASDPIAVPRYPAEDGAVKLSAAWLIERSGFPRGTRQGSVGISSRHSLALVHHGGGTTAELLGLARAVQAAVAATFGVTLRPEPIFLGLSAAEAEGLGATLV